MQDYNFYFNNKWLDSFGKVYVYEHPSDTKINEDIEYIDVDGRSGAYIKKKGTYKDRELSFKLNIINKDFYKTVDEIEYWVTNIKDNRLVYARQDKCYIVKTVELLDAKKENSYNGTITIKFRCEPFKTNLEEIEQSLRNKFYNGGDFSIEPTITIVGTGDIQLTINSDTIQFKNVNGVLIINSKLMTCIDGNGINKLNNMYGDFPIFEVGENLIGTEGSVSSIKIKYKNLYR